ncbi:MAG: AzlC family ABC transporter permease [Ilumatobacteraceae bacterium]
MSAPLVLGPRAGAKAVLPLGAAVGIFGVTFGVLAEDAGIGGVASIVFGVTTFAGSSQFAAAGVLSAGGTVTAAIIAALLLNARYVPIGISVAHAIDGPWWRRLAKAQLVVDESWAVGNLGGGRYDGGRLLGAGLVLYVAWITGTTIGVLAGDVIGDPETLGLDAAFPALFLALLIGQIDSRRALVAAAAGAAIAFALVPLVPPGVPIIAASVACLLGLRATAATGAMAVPDEGDTTPGGGPP